MSHDDSERHSFSIIIVNKQKLLSKIYLFIGAETASHWFICKKKRICPKDKYDPPKVKSDIQEEVDIRHL